MNSPEVSTSPLPPALRHPYLPVLPVRAFDSLELTISSDEFLELRRPVVVRCGDIDSRIVLRADCDGFVRIQTWD